MARRGRIALLVSCASGVLVACYAPYEGEDEIRAVDRTETPASAEAGTDGEPRGEDSGSDATTTGSGDAASDAAPPPPRCDRKKPFGAPVFIDSINSADHDADARLSADEKTLWFTSERGTVAPSKRHRMWKATRAGAGFDFVGIGLAFDYVDAELYDPTVSADGLTLVVQHTVTGANTANLEVATRAKPTDAFGPFTAILDAAGASERDPYFAADGTLLFTQDGRIARGKRVGSSWTSALVPELDALVAVRNPVMSADGREIFFSSDAGTPGKLRIHRAERASVTAKFGAASRVTELGGTASYEAPTWLSADGCQLLLTSDRGGGLDIYYAVRGK